MEIAIQSSDELEQLCARLREMSTCPITRTYRDLKSKLTFDGSACQSHFPSVPLREARHEFEPECSR
jgi:hypothetical protein